MYYNFSFCDDLGQYASELKKLNEFLPYNDIVVPNAKSMPFSFGLSKSRKIIACFEEKKYLFMLIAFLEETSRFLGHLKSLIPFDENYLNFAMNNTREIDPWNQAILFYNLHYFSNQLCSFDGPFEEVLDFKTFTKHINSLQGVNKRRFDVRFNEGPKGTKLYEFPDPETILESGSIVITNRTIQDLELLFQDKLKIYGV